jgi:hypothetical protein
VTTVCDICGKLMSEGFQPLDAIRSSHGMQRKRLDFQPEAVEQQNLFGQRPALVSDTAWACTVYSMVPYLGILFVPLALAIGGFSYWRAQMKREPGDGRTALLCVVLSLMLLAVQIILWRLLYLIPEIGI